MAFLNSLDQEIAIMQIQRILRDLELLDNEFSSVPISGVFDNETRDSVREFQSKYGIEVTGVVDYETWSAMHKIHHSSRFERRAPRRVRLIPEKGEFAIIPGQRDDIVYVIQYMLSSISPHYDSFGELEYTGVYDSKTENAIREFQTKNLIDDTGIIDGATLEALFEEYESVILEKS